MRNIGTMTAIENWLSEAELPADGRLPPERALAEQFGINRTELRKAMDLLEAEGRIRRHVGRGTFLTDVPRQVPPKIRDIAVHVGPIEAMQVRLIVEPEIASLAAMNATTAQIDELVQLTTEMKQRGRSWSEYEESDWKFHELLAASSGNKLLLEMERLLNGVRRVVIWAYIDKQSPYPDADYHSFAEHDAIVAAVQKRDRRAAKQAMEVHLRSTLSILQGEN